MEPIPRTSFSTDVISEKDRYAMWCESISVIFDVKRDDEDDNPFEAHLDAFMLGQVMVARTRSQAAHYIRSAQQARADSLDLVMVQLFLVGEVQFRCGKQVTLGQAGDIVIFDLSKEAFNYNTKYEHLTVLFPRAIVDEHFPEASLWHGQILPRELPMTRLLRSHIISLYDFGGGITTSCVESVQRSLIELTGAAFNNSSQHVGLDTGIVEATLLQEVKKHIRTHLTQPDLSAESTAAAFGLSRAQFYRLIEPLGGLMSYIRKLRLEGCMKDLTNAQLRQVSIAELAYKWGFNDVGTFTRSFKKQYQMLPSEAREFPQHVMKLPNNRIADQSLVSREYEQWVKSLT